MQLRGLERWISIVRLIAFPFVLAAVVAVAAYPPGGWAIWAWITTACIRDRRARHSSCFARSALGERPPVSSRVSRRRSSTPLIVTGYVMVFSFERGPAGPADPLHRSRGGLRPLRDPGRPRARGGLGPDRRRVREAARDPISVRRSAGSSSRSRPGSSADGADRRLARQPARRRGVGAPKPDAARGRRLLEAERRTVAELRRALDSAAPTSSSLVSTSAHADGVGDRLGADARSSAGASLSSEQRDAFLALIADETDRLAALIGEVLDSSRIDAGRSATRFGEVDLAGLR